MLLAAGQPKRFSVKRVLDDSARDSHLSMAGGLAGAVGRREAQGYEVDAVVAVIELAHVFAHELRGVVDSHRIFRMLLRKELIGGMGVFTPDIAINSLGTRINHALHFEETRRL